MNRSYVFTGPTRLEPDDEGYIRQVIRNLPPGESFTTGGAFGADTVCATAAIMFHPEAVHRIIIPAAKHHEEFVERMRHVAGVVIMEAEAGDSVPDSYMVRNDELVKAGDTLIAFTRGRTFYRSGEWATINRASAAGLDVWLYPLDEPRRYCQHAGCPRPATCLVTLDGVREPIFACDPHGVNADAGEVERLEDLDIVPELGYSSNR